MADDSQSEGSDRLNGWKEIASYLGKSVSSVQRWERQLGLPVRRIKTTDGQIVSGSRREIEAWRLRLEGLGEHLESEAADGAFVDAPPAPVVPQGVTAVPTVDGGETRLTPGRRWFVSRAVVLLMAAALLTVGAALGWWLLSPAGRPTTFLLVGTNLEARDSSGQVIWTHPFGRGVSGLFARNSPVDDRFDSADFDGDGTIEHVVLVHFGDANRASGYTDGLYVFSDSGTLLWNAVPDLAFSCGGEKLEGPWKLQAVQISRGPAPKRIWMAYTHHSSWPGLVIEVRPGGGLSLRYFQTGWIMSLTEWDTPAGVRLAAGGVIHDDNRPSVVLLDPDATPAFSGNATGRFRCENVPTGKPVRVTLLSNTDVTAALGSPYEMVNNLTVVGRDLKAEGAGYVASLQADGGVRGVLFFDAFWSTHQQLENGGRLTHPAGLCPYAINPLEILTWTPGAPRQKYLIQPTNVRTSARR